MVMPHLKLVAPEPPDPVYEALEPHLASGLLPADPVLLAMLVPGLPEPARLDAALQRLVAQGRLRRIHIGAEAHLLDAKREGRVPPLEGAAPMAEPPADTSESESMDFELEVSIDVETERGVLWRVALVITSLALLALLRQWLLIGLGAG